MRDKLAGMMLTLVLWGIRVMPLWAFGPCASVLARLAALVARRDVLQMRKNVHLIYGLPAGTHFARQFERQVLYHQAICMLETLRISYDPRLIALTGFPEFQAVVAKADAQGKGRIIVTAHLGSWELCAYYGHQAGACSFHVLAKPPRFPSVRRHLDDLRGRMGTPVLWTDRKTLLRDMLATLRNRQALGFVMDQKPEGRKGPVVPFFGQPTEFVSGPAVMAMKCGSPVVAIFCMREGPFRYRLFGEELVAAGEAGDDELALTARFARKIEDVIRAYPEQWTWNYKRWKSAPAS